MCWYCPGKSEDLYATESAHPTLVYTVDKSSPCMHRTPVLTLGLHVNCLKISTAIASNSLKPRFNDLPTTLYYPAAKVYDVAGVAMIARVLVWPQEELQVPKGGVANNKHHATSINHSLLVATLATYTWKSDSSLTCFDITNRERWRASRHQVYISVIL